MNTVTLSIGQQVFFGRRNGEKTLGKVLKLNRATVQVEQLESRGTLKNYPVGTKWKVAVALVTPAGEPTVTHAPAEPAAKRTEHEILRDIARIYGALSPENLHCDGEISATAARRRGAALTARLKACFRELGREVSEKEAWGL